MSLISDTRSILFEKSQHKFTSHMPRNSSTIGRIVAGISLSSGKPPPNQMSNSLKMAVDMAVQSLGWIIESGKQQGIYCNQKTEHLTLAALACVHGIVMLLGGSLYKPELNSG